MRRRIRCVLAGATAVATGVRQRWGPVSSAGSRSRLPSLLRMQVTPPRSGGAFPPPGLLHLPLTDDGGRSRAPSFLQATHRGRHFMRPVIKTALAVAVGMGVADASALEH